MKNPDRETVSQLEELPNIGNAISADLQFIGIHHPQQLKGKKPLQLYELLCSQSEKKHDPCVLDVFMSVVQFMDGGEALPWWEFTRERKRILRDKSKN